jgi:hypothetical protein
MALASKALEGAPAIRIVDQIAPGAADRWLLVADGQARRAARAQGAPGLTLPERQVVRLALKVKLAQAVEPAST